MAIESETMRAEFEAHCLTVWGMQADELQLSMERDVYRARDIENRWIGWHAAWSRAPSAEAKDAERWREVADKAWFVDAAATAYDLHGRQYSYQPSQADEDDVRDAVDAAIAQQEASRDV